MNLPRTLTVLLLQLACSGFTALAQVYQANAVGLYQFPFPAGANLPGQTEASGATWIAEGTGSPLKIEPGSLSVPGLAASQGNRARLVSGNAAASIAFSGPVSSNTIFLSCMLNVANLGATGPNGVLTAVRLNGWPDDWEMPWIRTVPGGYQIGAAASGGVPPSWFAPAGGSGTFKTSDTVFLVARYNARPPADNECDLWINPVPSSFGTANPPPPDLALTTPWQPDASQVSELLLRPNSSMDLGLVLDMDEIRVGTTWASVTPLPPALVGFSSGSDGSDGPIVVPSNAIVSYEWDFDYSGIINASSVRVEAGATLRFPRNANNTPVYLLATGDVQIDGTIDVSGEPGNAVRGGFGGPGGFDGGQPGSVGVEPGWGHGPGGGRWTSGFGGAGAHRTAPEANITTSGDGATYGHALQRPPSGGSGGSGHPGAGGGGGGGAILIASDTRIGIGPQGAILSYGGSAVPEHKYNAGAGGSIVLVAPVVEGSGRLAVNGGTGYMGANPRGSAGAGWIRIDALDRRNLNLTYEGSSPSLGTAMLSLITPVITLRITEVAGTPVANAGGPYTIVLPIGADPNIAVKLQAENFKARVPVVLYATPDSGERKAYAVTMDNLGPGAAETTLNLTLPVNQRVTLEAFAGKGLPTP